jgi:NAD(P)-dependent dehydrogenase (short-subunit alcohol dehydrogenase family)
MDFSEKVVLITGAANGLGKTAATMFASKGAIVILADIDHVEGQKSKEDIISSGYIAHFFKCNVSIENDIIELMKFIAVEFKSLDIAINNAGIGGTLAPTHLYPTDEFSKIMSINCTGVFLCMKYELEIMSKQGYGAILNVSSAAGLCGMANNAAYTASKHAVIGLTKAAALEYAKSNIRINAICPSFTITNMVEELFEKIGEGKEILRKNIPMKRFGQPEEIAHAMVWLCSDNNSFMTGAAIPVDGGFLAT